jgi:N-acetylglutamate synthase-like GNAT family acetyltransferase
MKTQDITYRQARNSDSEAIQAILKAAFKEYKINLPDSYSFSDIENLEEEYLNAPGEFRVFLREQKIIGFFALLPSNNSQIELKRLYLTVGERRKGLGRCLLKMALGVAKKSGYVQLHLETSSKFVEAVSLYRKFGFTKNIDAKLAQGHDIGLVMDLIGS